MYIVATAGPSKTDTVQYDMSPDLFTEYVWSLFYLSLTQAPIPTVGQSLRVWGYRLGNLPNHLYISRLQTKYRGYFVGILLSFCLSSVHIFKLLFPSPCRHFKISMLDKCKFMTQWQTCVGFTESSISTLFLL